MASKAGLVKCFTAACARSAGRRSVPIANNAGALGHPPSTLSSRITRFRGAIVALHSCNPLHSAVAESLFVSKLRLGTYEPCFLGELDHQPK